MKTSYVLMFIGITISVLSVQSCSKDPQLTTRGRITPPLEDMSALRNPDGRPELWVMNRTMLINVFKEIFDPQDLMVSPDYRQKLESYLDPIASRPDIFGVPCTYYDMSIEGTDPCYGGPANAEVSVAAHSSSLRFALIDRACENIATDAELTSVLVAKASGKTDLALATAEPYNDSVMLQLVQLFYINEIPPASDLLANLEELWTSVKARRDESMAWTFSALAICRSTGWTVLSESDQGGNPAEHSPALDGKTLYNTSCKACHNDFDSSAKKGISIERLEQALRDIPQMNFLSLSVDERKAIVNSLQ